MKKDNILTLLFISVIALFTGCMTSYATSYLYNSQEVTYNNSSSGISATNVKSAIDSLYSSADNYSSVNTRVTKLENISNYSTSNGWTLLYNDTLNRGSGTNLPSSWNELVFFVSVYSSTDTWYTFYVNKLFPQHKFIEGYGYNTTLAQIQITSTQLIVYDTWYNGSRFNPKVVIWYR